MRHGLVGEGIKIHIYIKKKAITLLYEFDVQLK